MASHFSIDGVPSIVNLHNYGESPFSIAMLAITRGYTQRFFGRIWSRKPGKPPRMIWSTGMMTSHDHHFLVVKITLRKTTTYKITYKITYIYTYIILLYIYTITIFNYIYNNYRHCIWNHQPICHGQKNKNQLGGTVKHRYLTTILQSHVLIFGLRFKLVWSEIMFNPGNSRWNQWLISPRCSTWGYQPLGDSNHLEYLGDINSGVFFQYLQATPPSPARRRSTPPKSRAFRQSSKRRTLTGAGK